MTQFQALGLSKQILNTVAASGFDAPTPIQQNAIPLVLEGKDVLGIAQTGTGKTAAFGLPLVDKLMADRQRPFPKSARALILAPTRELVNQIATNLRGFVKQTPLRIATIVGGASINNQIRDLNPGRDIVVATPGRLIDLMERNAIILAQTKFLVLDEADQMLDLGFIHALKRIAKALPKERQTLLFSATMPQQIESLAQTYLTDPERVEVSPPGKTVDKIFQTVHHVSQRGKTDLLKQCLSERPDDLSLVFARTKHGAEKLMKHLVANGFEAASIHGNKSQNQRERAIRDFKAGSVRILVATDVAARGIDIPGVSHVYNYDLPNVPESYVHRIGRTARAGAEGRAVAFCSPDEAKLLRDIEKLAGISITVASGEPPARGSRPAGNDNRGGQPRRNDQPKGDGQKRPNRNRRRAGGAKPAGVESANASKQAFKPKRNRNRRRSNAA